MCHKPPGLIAICNPCQCCAARVVAEAAPLHNAEMTMLLLTVAHSTSPPSAGTNFIQIHGTPTLYPAPSAWRDEMQPGTGAYVLSARNYVCGSVTWK